MERNPPQLASHGDRLDAGIGPGALGGHAAAGHLPFHPALLNDVFAVVVVMGRILMADKGQHMILLALNLLDHFLQRFIGVLPYQQRVQSFFQTLQSPMKDKFRQLAALRLQFLPIPDDAPQLQVECHEGTVLGKGVDEGPYLAENMRHAGLAVADNLGIGVPAVHDQQTEEPLPQDDLYNAPAARCVRPVIGAALVGEYPQPPELTLDPPAGLVRLDFRTLSDIVENFRVERLQDVTQADHDFRDARTRQPQRLEADEIIPDPREGQRAHHPQPGHLDQGVQADVRARQGPFRYGRDHLLTLAAPFGFAHRLAEDRLLGGRRGVFNESSAVRPAGLIGQVGAA